MAAAPRLELADAGGVERVDRSDRSAVERGIQLAPLAGRHDRAGGQPHRFQHHADDHRIGREHFAQQRDRRLVGAAVARRLNRSCQHFATGVLEHRASQHILGFGVGRHTEAGHVDADDAYAVDLLGQDLQRHAAGRRHAQVDDDDGVVLRRVGLLVDSLADVLEQFAGDQRFGVERHIADAALRAVEMRGEGQAVDTAGRTRQDRRSAAHAQADAQRTECRAHALRLVVRAGLRVDG
jgi:hypothetical protein